MSYKTNEMLSSVKTTDNDILKINAKLDPNKAHGHNKINIHMIKICTFFGSHRAIDLFNHCIDNALYPCEYKKDNLVSVHKKMTNKP